MLGSSIGFYTGNSPQPENIPNYKKYRTPITNYQKSLHDARVTKQYGGKISSLRPYLNFSWSFNKISEKRIILNKNLW